MSARPDSVAIQVFEDAPNLTITGICYCLYF